MCFQVSFFCHPVFLKVSRIPLLSRLFSNPSELAVISHHHVPLLWAIRSHSCPLSLDLIFFATLLGLESHLIWVLLTQVTLWALSRPSSSTHLHSSIHSFINSQSFSVFSVLTVFYSQHLILKTRNIGIYINIVIWIKFILHAIAKVTVSFLSININCSKTFFFILKLTCTSPMPAMMHLQELFQTKTDLSYCSSKPKWTFAKQDT